MMTFLSRVAKNAFALFMFCVAAALWILFGFGVAGCASVCGQMDEDCYTYECKLVNDDKGCL